MPEARVVAGRYRLLSLLGAGGMGQVWLAEDELLNRQVAIKVLLAVADDADADMKQRIMREARTAARLSHPNAVGVHDLIIDDGKPYVVMEYVSGYTLDDRVRKSGRLDPRAAGPLIGQVASALAAAHRLGIVHRDVKPANVLITSEGIARLADFGIARADTDSQLTGTGMVIGSLAYMAPEVAEGGHATPLSDIWSLGATLFAAVEGRAPFEGESTMRMLYRLFHEEPPAPAHGGHLAELISRMLARDPAQRPGAAELADQLVPAAGRSPSLAPSARDDRASTAETATAMPTLQGGTEAGGWAPTELSMPKSPTADAKAEWASASQPLSTSRPYAPTELGAYAVTPAPEARTPPSPGRDQVAGVGPDAAYASTQLRDPRNEPTTGRGSRRKWYLVVGGCAAVVVIGVVGFLLWHGSSGGASRSSTGAAGSSCTYDIQHSGAYDVAHDYMRFASRNEVAQAQQCTYPGAVPAATAEQIVGKKFAPDSTRDPYVFFLDDGKTKVSVDVTTKPDGHYYVTNVVIGAY